METDKSFKYIKGDNMDKLIKIISMFDTVESKCYWIFRLNTTDYNKALLLQHFKLN